MRIVIITQGITRIVEPLLSSAHQIVGIVEGSYKEQYVPEQRLSCQLADMLFFAAKHKHMLLASLAKKKHLPYFFLTQKNFPALQNWLNNLTPDLIVVYSMSYLLPPTIISIPRYGCVNLHPSHLPEYRGPNPIFWQYYNKEQEGGVTVHYIDPFEDTGAIINQETFNIPQGLSWNSFLDLAIGKVGTELLLKTIGEIEHNRQRCRAQPATSTTTRATRVSGDEYLRIIQRHSWSLPELWHFLRGTEPWLNDILYFKRSIGQTFHVADLEKCSSNCKTDTPFYKNGSLNINGHHIPLERKFSYRTLLTNIMF